MRLSTFVAGLGTAALSSFALGATNYNTIFTNDDAGYLWNVSSVALQSGLRAAAIVNSDIVVDQDNTLFFTDAVFYKQAQVPGTFRIVAKAGDSDFSSPSNSTFNNFSNLSFASNQIVFLSGISGDGQIGIYSDQPGVTPVQQTLAIDNQSIQPSGTLTITPGAGLTVSAGGNVLLGGQNGSGQVIAHATTSEVRTIVDDAGSFSGFNGPAPIARTKKVFTESGSSAFGVFLAEHTVGVETQRVIVQANVANGAASIRYNGSAPLTIGGDSYTVSAEQLVGATSSSTVFVGELTGPGVDSSNNHALLYHSGLANSAPTLLSQFGESAMSNGGSPIGLKAEMTAAGNGAVLINDSIYYVSGASVQQVVDTTSEINGIGIASIAQDTAPMVNDSGYVVFFATLDDNSKALLAWNAATDALIEIAKQGSTITLDGGSEVTLQDLFSTSLDSSGLFFDYDPLKDGLSDDNYVAFTIAYGESFDTAVVYAALPAVPEPGAGMLMMVGAAPLLLRRRRR